MKYDDASWHYGGDFPKGLPDEAGATHIGMFVAWALLNGLAGEFFLTEGADSLALLKSRRLTPGTFLLDECDEKFTDDMLNEEGNAFAQDYYDPEKGQYSEDYAEILAENAPTIYHVPDTWKSYDKLAPVIASRFKEWKRRQRRKWWQFWK
jgi:hypothetical protein